MSKQAADDLKRARAVVADEEAWVQGEFCTFNYDDDNRRRTDVPSAYCVEGALYSAMGIEDETIREHGKIHFQYELQEHQDEKFDRYVETSFYYHLALFQLKPWVFKSDYFTHATVRESIKNGTTFIPYFNDDTRTKHEDVLEIFDHAIELAKSGRYDVPGSDVITKLIVPSEDRPHDVVD